MMAQTRGSSALQTVVQGNMADVEAAVRAALAAEGFGVLTEIDVAATLRAKLGVDRNPLKILGACNPSFAHRALGLDPSLALVLPCNVVVEDQGDGRTSVVIADPRIMLGGETALGPELEALAEEAATALERAVELVGS
jgi:uncharacterized protein (DUF302 family)